MAGELTGIGLSGSTHYFIARNASNQPWNGTAFENWTDANIATYAVTATEQGTSGFFTGNTPSASATKYVMRRRVGASVALSDPVVWEDHQSTVVTNNDKTGYSLSAPDSRVIESGTAQAGSTSTTIKFAAGASAASGIYNGEVVFVYGGTGAKQTRTITAYSGTTKVATVDRAWQTTPDNTSLYAVLSVIAAPMNAALQVESSTDELLAIKSNNSRPPAGWPSQFTASLDNGTDTFTNEVFIWCADIDATMGTGTWAIGSFPVIKAPGYVQQSAIGTAYGVIGLIVGDRVYFFLNDAGDWNGEDYKGWHWDGTTFTDGVTISSEPNYFATWTTVGTVTASFSNFVVYNPVRALGTGGNPVTTNPAGQVETSNPGGGLTTDQDAKLQKIYELAQT